MENKSSSSLALELCDRLFEGVKKYSTLDGVPDIEYQMEFFKSYIKQISVIHPEVINTLKNSCNIIAPEQA